MRRRARPRRAPTVGCPGRRRGARPVRREARGRAPPVRQHGRRQRGSEHRREAAGRPPAGGLRRLPTPARATIRCSSADSTMRRREAARCSTRARASACMRAFATASLAAAATEATSGGSSTVVASCSEHGDSLVPLVDRGDHSVRPEIGELDRPPTIVHVPAQVGHPVADHHGRIAERSGELVAQRSETAALAEADHKIRHRRRRPPTRQADRRGARWRPSPRRRRSRSPPSPRSRSHPASRCTATAASTAE